MSSTASVDDAKQATTAGEAQSRDPVNEYEDAEKNFKPKSIKFWSIMTGMYLSFFLVGLDRMIIAAAVPRITDEFDSLDDIGWYGSAYMLTAACFMPISGRVYQLYSTKWTFLFSILVFEVGSTLCGAAPNSIAFIIGRAIAGLGSAGVFSGGTMITLPLIPLRKRPVASSMFGLAFGASSVLGPLLGGLFTDHVTWRWCFYLNLPIGGFTVLVIILFLHVESPKRDKLSFLAQIKRLDPIGIFFFVPAIISLILALQWGGTTYTWSNPKVIGLLVTFAVLFICFIVVEVLTPQTAMAPTRVILNRSIAGSMFFMFLISGGMMSTIYYLTIWFQAAKNTSAIRSGINTLPLILSFIIMGILAAVLTQKIGYYVPSMLMSVVLCSVAAGLLSTLSPSSGQSTWIGYQILYGFGIGFGFQTSMLPPQNVLPRVDVPLGLALMFFMQQLGGSVFLSVSQNIFSSRLVHNLSGLAGLDAQTIVNTGATALHTMVPEDELSTVLTAYNDALTRVFILAAGLSAFMLLGALAVEWTRMGGEKQSEKDGEHKAPEGDVDSKEVQGERPLEA
ncbi:uncharacterized protein A1O9_04325 [Exophiala aquamarina CBS 119918]|uniref:Major facilitator superfamily (MFS) profile domain-containing protein n=1 Tax=Exophiala aquamarina CBS 119918 TaxID=1182545 RepID=A0A072PHX5_9EURO|nr:uncharacterized protein A1O9_04325 [Exophiala aquamarina CBS 119918]KEF59481.1 hypothetical protein A1O9_04325 [Exophiala aquamarina CBS 119918]